MPKFLGYKAGRKKVEILTLKKEFKFWEELSKWVCGIFCYRGENKHSILVNSWDKNRNKAEEKAMNEFRKSLNFYKEFERKSQSIIEKYEM